MGSTRDGFVATGGDAENFGRHFFTCSYCQIDLDDMSRDRFCPEGVRLRDKVLATPENRAYLIRMADDWAEEEWHRDRMESVFPTYSTEELLARERRFMDAQLP